ncbi:MAG: DinB family protein [Acidobacteriota bacterium]
MLEATQDLLNTRWTEIGDKLVKLAEEFPEDKYEYKPSSDVRSFGDQLRHVAFWNDYAAQTLRGEKADGDANELPRAKYGTKAKVVSALRSSFEGVPKGLEKAGATPAAAETVVSFIEHNGEHYGQLVMYYRLNGLVPPASR